MTKRLTPAAIALSFAASAAVYPKLPEPLIGAGRTPLIGKPMLAFLLPAAAALIYGIFLWLGRRDPVLERSDAFDATFQGLVLRIALFILGLHAIILIGLVSGANLASRAVPVLLGLGVVAVGDLLPRLRPNVALGLRTPETFMNRALWMRVHRVVGYATVGFGIVIVVSGLVLSSRAAGNAILAVGLSAMAAIVWYCRRISRSVADRNP